MTTLAYTILDVFTDTPLQGNAVAVFTDGSQLDEATMQRLARELNLSETVFALAPSVGWPAKGSSLPGVKMRMRASPPSLGASANTVSERFVSRASRCIVASSSAEPEGMRGPGAFARSLR